jgi:hypothetical protein
MTKFKAGDVVEVESDELEFLCSITALLPDEAVKEFEDCVAIYVTHWEGAINPDVEPKIVLWEYTNGDIFASDDSKDGFDYQEVNAKIYEENK